jgi:probable HAF family extracellular repeat protein
MIGTVLGRKILVAALVLVALPGSTAAGSPAAAPTFTFVDLGALGSSADAESAAWDVNEQRQVVGASETDTFGAPHAFLWADGELRDLGTLGGGAFAASAAYGIDEAGRIVGQSSPERDDEPPHAFRYRRGEMKDLGTGFGPGSFSRAWDSSDKGLTVGERARRQDAALRAFLLRKGKFRDLGTLGGRSQGRFGTDAVAYAINERGQIVGTALPPTPPLHGFIWEDGRMRDLGTLGGDDEATLAYGINEATQVVGESPTTQGRVHAFLWEAGTMRDLGTLGGNASAAYDVNAQGQVVGGSRTPTSPPGNAGHAFLWHDGRIYDLNDLVPGLPSDVTLELARGIADDGTIVGTTCTEFCEAGKTAPTRAFLLIPS